MPTHTQQTNPTLLRYLNTALLGRELTDQNLQIVEFKVENGIIEFTIPAAKEAQDKIKQHFGSIQLNIFVLESGENDIKVKMMPAALKNALHHNSCTLQKNEARYILNALQLSHLIPTSGNDFDDDDDDDTQVQPPLLGDNAATTTTATVDTDDGAASSVAATVTTGSAAAAATATTTTIVADTKQYERFTRLSPLFSHAGVGAMLSHIYVRRDIVELSNLTDSDAHKIAALLNKISGVGAQVRRQYGSNYKRVTYLLSKDQLITNEAIQSACQKPKASWFSFGSAITNTTSGTYVARGELAPSSHGSLAQSRNKPKGDDLAIELFPTARFSQAPTPTHAVERFTFQGRVLAFREYSGILGRGQFSTEPYDSIVIQAVLNKNQVAVVPRAHGSKKFVVEDFSFKKGTRTYTPYNTRNRLATISFRGDGRSPKTIIESEGGFWSRNLQKTPHRKHAHEVKTLNLQSHIDSNDQPIVSTSKSPFRAKSGFAKPSETFDAKTGKNITASHLYAILVVAGIQAGKAVKNYQNTGFGDENELAVVGGVSAYFILGYARWTTDSKMRTIYLSEYWTNRMNDVEIGNVYSFLSGNFPGKRHVRYAESLKLYAPIGRTSTDRLKAEAELLSELPSAADDDAPTAGGAAGAVPTC